MSVPGAPMESATLQAPAGGVEGIEGRDYFGVTFDTWRAIGLNIVGKAFEHVAPNLLTFVVQQACRNRSRYDLGWFQCLS